MENAWGRVGESCGKITEHTVIVVGCVWMSGGGCDFGQPQSGVKRRAIVSNCIFNKATCYFGGLESVQVSNCIFINSTWGVRCCDEVQSGNLVHISVDNCIFLYTEDCPGETRSAINIGASLKSLRVTNCQFIVKATAGEFVFLEFDAKKDYVPDELDVVFQNCHMYTPGPRTQYNDLYVSFTGYSGRKSKKQAIKVIGCTIYTENPPLGTWTMRVWNDFDEPFGYFDRIIASRIYWAYNFSLYAFEDSKFKVTLSPSVGVNDTYGDPVKYYPPLGFIKWFKAKISVSGIDTTANEVVTVKIECVWSSGNTTYIEKQFTNDGSVWLTDDEIMSIWRDRDELVHIYVYAKTNLSSTNASVTIDLFGA